MGIPSLFRKRLGAEFLAYQPAGNSEFGGLVDAEIMRFVGHPVVGIAGLSAEGYFGGRSNGVEGGARFYFMVPSLLVGAGIDHSFNSGKDDFILKLDVPMRRSGIVGAGSCMTFRWLPGRDQTFSVGLSVPVGDRDMGRTRPQSDYVKMDDRRPRRLGADQVSDPDSTLQRELAVVRERARWIAELTQPFADNGGADAAAAMAPRIEELRAHMALTDALFPHGHTANEEIRVYHETLDHLFSIAESGDVIAPGESTERGRAISAAARRILLDDLILPYDRLIGQLKKKDTLSGMIAVTQTNFVRWLLTTQKVDTTQAQRIAFVFQSLCDFVEENRSHLRERWGDNRYVWLPLQYGLTPAEHDSQEEFDDIIARATQRDFTAGNRVWYIVNEEFQYEMARSVRLAQDYHVLWIHDFAGVNHAGEPDAIAYEQVRNYLLALTEHVRAYDTTGKFPMYIIFLDQHYFETNKSRLWMKLLEDPMRYHVDLPKKFAPWEQELERMQADLRKAVDESIGLQIEKSQFGDDWLYNRIRVQVNITNPADYSFYSMKMIGKMPIPDNNMRDHRKIIFYDITEDDPYRGMAMFTGMGLGEHYTGATWEDRALMLQGPAALETKNAARFLLETQGFTPDQIPFPLRARPKAPTYDAAVAAELATYPDYVSGRVIELHNETGFTPKPLSVAKCVLYSLMPPRSVMKVPDSLWQSYLYASLMAGSSLRGCRSIIIAPTLRSAPSSGAPQMARANGLMKRLVVFGNAMDDYMQREGGILAVGLYSPKQGVGDIAGRVEQAMSLSDPRLARVSIRNSAVDSVASRVRDILGKINYHPAYLTPKDSLESPKLHLKANFFASSEVWDGLMSRPEWAGVVDAYIRYLAEQQGTSSSRDVRAIPEELQQGVRALLDGYFSGLSAEEKERMVAFFTIGSCNMDYRSQVMNGEVMVTLAGARSLIGVLDFLMLEGLCEWPRTPDDVDRLIPPPGWFTRKMSGAVKVAL
ncbi:MAG TPA: hypothetical protein VFH88_10455 [Candidatus Krumholzibacteria bacterium]|nr:hypothetical protein [Candidatus Krumholzibacteria bacterium]